MGAEVDEQARSTSKSAVRASSSRRTRENLIDLMSRSLEDLRLAVLMLDGIDLKGRCCVVALGIDSDALQSTNPCESMVETVRRTSRNVTRWHNGDMCPRWTAGGMLEAEQQFRRMTGHSKLPALAVAVERGHRPPNHP